MRARSVGRALGGVLVGILAWGCTGKSEPPSISGHPQRIVSLAPAITECLFAIGAGRQVCAVTTVDNYPPEVEKLPKIGGFTPRTINLEAILALRPDLVVGTRRLQEQVITRVEELGLRTLSLDATTIEEVAANLRRLGQETGHTVQGEAVAAELLKRVQAVRERTAGVPLDQRPRVMFVIWDEPLQTASSSSFIGQMLEDAGGINVFAELQGEYPRVTDEAVLAQQPEAILTPDHDNRASLPTRIAERAGWQQLQAIRQQRVVPLDADLVNRPGPRVVDGLESIYRALYDD